MGLAAGGTGTDQSTRPVSGSTPLIAPDPSSRPLVTSRPPPGCRLGTTGMLPALPARRGVEGGGLEQPVRGVDRHRQHQTPFDPDVEVVTGAGQRRLPPPPHPGAGRCRLGVRGQVPVPVGCRRVDDEDAVPGQVRGGHPRRRHHAHRSLRRRRGAGQHHQAEHQHSRAAQRATDGARAANRRRRRGLVPDLAQLDDRQRPSFRHQVRLADGSPSGKPTVSAPARQK